MKFALPRRHRKSFEVITKKKLDENINKTEAIQICNEIKKAYNIDEIIQFLENSVLRNDIGIIKKQKKLLDRLNLSNPKCVPACENIYNFINKSLSI